MTRIAPPHLFVIFGGTGDLTAKKLLPSLASLFKDGRLGERSRILAVGRRDTLGHESYRRWAREALEKAGYPEADRRAFAERILYHPVRELSEKEYRMLDTQVAQLDKEHGLQGNRVFYLALPPALFGPTIEHLDLVGLTGSEGFTRVVIEKPFGHDLESACALNEKIHQHLKEEQVYRIDHYLGKETVQNLLVFRFGNTIFEDLWNRDRVESVQITVAEKLGVEERAGFYESAGALRDIVQNHLTQVLTLAAMEVPVTFDADAVRYEKVKVLRAMKPIARRDVVRGQYGPGKMGSTEVRGYREEDGVSPDSATETFVAMRLDIDNWRWQGVPFYIRTGKRLPQKLTEIAVVFRRPPVCMFESMGYCPLDSNVLYITLQPNEGFTMTMDVKTPGDPMGVKRIPLQFRYGEEFGPLPDAYETLILDVLEGDQTLFVHADEAEASWQLYSPLLEDPPELETYASGTWGPASAHDLLARDGHTWQLRRR